MLRFFLSFRKAVALGQRETMMDDSDWTGVSPGLDTVFWKTRTTTTGPGITFRGTKGSTAATNSRAYSGFWDALRPIDVRNTATTSNKHGFDLELSVISPSHRLPSDQDRDNIQQSVQPT